MKINDLIGKRLRDAFTGEASLEEKWSSNLSRSISARGTNNFHTHGPFRPFLFPLAIRTGFVIIRRYNCRASENSRRCHLYWRQVSIDWFIRLFEREERMGKVFTFRENSTGIFCNYRILLKIEDYQNLTSSRYVVSSLSCCSLDLQEIEKQIIDSRFFDGGLACLDRQSMPVLWYY